MQQIRTKQQLVADATRFSGLTLGELANYLKENPPPDLQRAKGWVGQLLEKALGASAGNLDIPDFPELGIELKTLPINEQRQPQESTYLCRISFPVQETDFYHSRVWRKLAQILWIPIEASASIPLIKRRIGVPILWSPCPDTEQILKQDWEELINMMRFGAFETINAQLGTYLQLRPKAANSRTYIQVTNDQGTTMPMVPKGFYLRTALTQKVLSTLNVSV